MKNARAELVDVGHGIDKLAHQMTGIPLDTDVIAFRFIEEPFPHRRLGEHIETHDGQVIRTHGTMLEGDTHAFVRRAFGDRLPKFNQAGQEILERLINRILPLGMGFQLDDRAWKTGHGRYPDVCSDLDSTKKDGPSKLALGRVEGILVKGADSGDPDVARFGFGGELIGKGAPVLFVRSCAAGFEAVPAD